MWEKATVIVGRNDTFDIGLPLASLLPRAQLGVYRITVERLKGPFDDAQFAPEEEEQCECE